MSLSGVICYLVMPLVVPRNLSKESYLDHFLVVKMEKTFETFWRASKHKLSYQFMVRERWYGYLIMPLVWPRSLLTLTGLEGHICPSLVKGLKGHICW